MQLERNTIRPTRRRFLGSAALTMLTARLGMTGSARAYAAEEPAMTMTATPRYVMQDAASTDIRPFQIDVPQADLDDLQQRLGAVRWPSQELVADRSQGVQLETLQAVTRYWETDHDWRKIEATLNALPQFMTEIDGVDIHFIHVTSPHENALPLIMTHGWPGSVIELIETIGPLTDPTAYGGNAEDAFHLVLPSLPGYGSPASPPISAGTSAASRRPGRS